MIRADIEEIREFLNRNRRSIILIDVPEGSLDEFLLGDFSVAWGKGVFTEHDFKNTQQTNLDGKRVVQDVFAEYSKIIEDRKDFSFIVGLIRDQFRKSILPGLERHEKSVVYIGITIREKEFFPKRKAKVMPIIDGWVGMPIINIPFFCRSFCVFLKYK